MRRRDFLARFLLAAGAYPTDGFGAIRLPPLQAPGPRRRVAVIGAGLAGLCAAYELAQRGHDVAVLESRSTPGGRVRTLREPFADGLFAEAGASRIPDNHDLTLKYARAFGLVLDPFWPQEGSSAFVIAGERLRTRPGTVPALAEIPLPFTEDEKSLGLSGLMARHLQQALQDAGDPLAPDWPPAALRPYETQTLTTFLRARGVSEAAIRVLNLPHLTPEEDRVSLLWILREIAHERQERTRYKIRGGNDQLPRAFARHLGDRIRYGVEVTGFEQDGREVRVAFRTAWGGTQTLAADRVICAVPFTVLRRMDVAPAFPPDKRRAIAELPYESCTRVLLQVRNRYWDRDGWNGFGVADWPGEVWHPTHDQPGPRAVLVLNHYAGRARRTWALNASERQQLALRHLESVYPGAREHSEAISWISWDADPWSRGAVSVLAPGQFDLLRACARPEGRVHFAGEHASNWPAWMQGALESGNRAAREILVAT